MKRKLNIIDKLILQKYPDYDFDRYRYKAGDYVESICGAKMIVEYSAIEYVSAFVIRRSLQYRKYGQQRVYYKDLPYYAKGEFINGLPKVNETLYWNVYDIVYLEESNMRVLLTQEVKHQCFYGFVLETENNYYKHTSIYLENPYKQYIINEG